MIQQSGTQIVRMLLAPIGQNDDRPTTSKPQPRQSEASEAIIQQLTILAEALGETMTPARLKIYAADLVDLTAEQLAVAFNRARRERRFFPKIEETAGTRRRSQSGGRYRG